MPTHHATKLGRVISAAVVAAGLTLSVGVPASAYYQTLEAEDLGTGYVPAQDSSDVRVATFDVNLVGSSSGELTERLSTPGDRDASQVAQIIQRVRPEVIVVTGFDTDADQANAEAFSTNYLAVGSGEYDGIDYPYSYAGPVNSGVDSGADLDQDGTIGGPGDALGHGEYPGQGGMVIYSQYPIDTDNIRTFNNLSWTEVPDSKIAQTGYSENEKDLVPLTSVGAWDVPISVHGRPLHVLASASAEASRSETHAYRQDDQVGFWADYVGDEQPDEQADGANDGAGADDQDYITDDEGTSGGLDDGARFVVAGQLTPGTAESRAEDSETMSQLLDVDRVTDPEPTSSRDSQQATEDVATHTWLNPDPAPGDPRSARTDYILPSEELPVTNSGVYWPASGQDGAELVGGTASLSGLLSKLSRQPAATDHRLVWADINPQP
ncbi:endonuclease/exonuclease/phosphatase family protein [Auritidibacter ignavus]|uniref:endonuclease/exonuclease/phosphatase family protein n=1 Tax=Auritidibacter ignavus TaxID=678932 RepID=UPI0011B22874|nr:endonuclease/exonuclease/phosphatase family protein [Auritidibacter ignavus]WHS34003.1 hypothetical protein QM403_06375 [Auritidibacter ignavus]